MNFISNHVAVIESTNEVAFFTKQPDFNEPISNNVAWKKVEDLPAWIAFFFDNVRDIAACIDAGPFLIEKNAFEKSF